MSGTVILIVIITITVCLGRYAIAEGQRAERQKRFMKKLKDFDKNNK